MENELYEAIMLQESDQENFVNELTNFVLMFQSRQVENYNTRY